MSYTAQTNHWVWAWWLMADLAEPELEMGSPVVRPHTPLKQAGAVPQRLPAAVKTAGRGPRGLRRRKPHSQSRPAQAEASCAAQLVPEARQQHMQLHPGPFNPTP